MKMADKLAQAQSAPKTETNAEAGHYQPTKT